MIYVDNPFESPVVLSFCPGILGLERGIERAIGKLRVAAYVEIEAFIIANLVTGMEAGVLDSAPIWTNAETFDARPFRGRIHGIIGGYPCPGESLAGLREGHLYKGFIWPSIRRAIDAARPLWCFFENVDDHLTGTYPIVQRSLRNMGYAVEAGIYSAEEVGSTCERKRIFILAVAHSDFMGTIRGLRNLLHQAEKNEGKTQRQDGKRGRHELIDNSEEMDCTNGSRFQVGSKLQSGPRQGLQKFISRSEKVFPMPQGYEQYEWEPPRVESSMVYNVAGYNFREDLVRAIGNSVVEQTAELAFRELLQKHF